MRLLQKWASASRANVPGLQLLVTLGKQKATQPGLRLQNFLHQHWWQYHAKPSFRRAACAKFSTIVPDQSIKDNRSSNLMYTLMTGLLDIEPDERILEISTGSGYQRTVLATLGSTVSSIEYSIGLNIRLTTRLSPPLPPPSCKSALKNSLRRVDVLLVPIGRQRET